MTESPQEATDRWLATLLRGFEQASGTFVEALPRRSGRARRRSGRIHWRHGTLRDPKLSGAVTIERLDGLVRLELVAIDAIDTLGGGSSEVHAVARLAVAKGRARVYVRVDEDFGRVAAALGGGRPPDPPVVRRGYRYGEATPEEPARVQGELSRFGSDLGIWVESVDGPAEGLRLELSSP